MAESKEELKSLLMRMIKESEKVGLKLIIQTDGIWSHHFMANRWGNSGNSDNLILGVSKSLQIVTADGDHSHEITRCLLLGRNAMTNLDSVLKGRDITLQTKVHIVKSMVFLLVLYGYESWTIKKAEHRRTDAFKLWC